MAKRSRTPGICRIDQPSKRTHGFFVRLHFRGKNYPAFFADQTHGGRKQALAAAQAHYRKLRAKLGLPRKNTRRWQAEVVRRKGPSGIYGVQMVIVRKPGYLAKFWCATWSPQPYVHKKAMFSIRKYGDREAREMAIWIRKKGLAAMSP